MKEKKYVKPSIRIVELRNREKIAKQCFRAGDSKPVSNWYFDLTEKGQGWISFNTPNCELDLIFVKYHDSNNPEGVEVTNPETIDKYEKLLLEHIPSNGKWVSFTNQTTIAPNTPGESWS